MESTSQGRGSGPGRSGPSTGASVASVLGVLFGCGTVTWREWRGWHTSLFIWGMAVAVSSVGYAEGNALLALHLVPNASVAARARLRSRRRQSQFALGAIGVGVAIMAGGTGWVGVDAVATAVLVLVGSSSTFLGIQVIRRRQSDAG